LAVTVDENRITAALVHSVYPGDERCGLICLVADANGVGLGRNTQVADIDIVIARGEISTGSWAQGDVAAARCIAEKRFETLGRVVARIASVRCRRNGASCRRKRQADEHERDEQEASRSRGTNRIC
jgi:hypothetical protein